MLVIEPILDFYNLFSCLKSLHPHYFLAGFLTAKGDLVRSILFPKPTDFKFSQDAYKFIGVLFAIAAVGMVYTYVIMVSPSPPQIASPVLLLIFIFYANYVSTSNVLFLSKHFGASIKKLCIVALSVTVSFESYFETLFGVSVMK